MPTYYALGITGTLSVANLQASLSNVVDLKQRAEQRSDAQRVSDVLTNGQNLPERPIGQNGDEKGVQQFLGVQQDMPFFMVEAGEGVRRNCIGLRKEETGESRAPSNVTAEDVDTSPLTSLEATPSLGTPDQSARKSPTPATPGPSRARRAGQRHMHTPEPNAASAFSGFERARGYLEQASGPQALCLTIETCNKSFLLSKPDSTSRASGKDLKIEVFVNGQLAGISFVNRRGSAIELIDNKVRFQGMRIHRQTEKPWVYDVEVHANCDKATVDERWQAIRKALGQEAKARGRNKLGDPSPSAEFLYALADISMPERLNGKGNIGVVDVIITAGAGKKFGPEMGYLVGPTRMINNDYRTYQGADSADPFSDDVVVLDDAADETSPLHDIAATALATFASSPEVPLMRQRSTAALPETPTKKQKTVDLTSELDLSNVSLKKQVASFENSHGKTGQRGRTLKQRLGDIRKMNGENQQKQLAVLREELGEDALRALKKEVMDDEDMQPSPSKKAKLDTSCDFGLNMLADTALAGPDTIDPMKTWRSTPAPTLLPDGADSDAIMTQSRIDMALEAGAGFSGPLLRRIASTSPQRTPKKKTRASALAGSPCAVPVKEQLSSRKRPTPQHRSTHFHNGSPIPIDPALTGTPPSTTKRSGRGALRTREKWDPSEMTANEALKAFRVPELSKGSVVSYGEDDGMQRQIGKARNGEFREETLVVGMRFVVV